MKILTLITAFICLIGLGAKAQQEQGNSGKIKSEADIFWETKPVSQNLNIVELPNSYSPQQLAEYNKRQLKSYMYKEIYARFLREWGIEFWRRFPEDTRRFEWFMQTCGSGGPVYFANLREGAIAEVENRFVVPLDTIARNEWQLLYNSYLNEFLTSNEVEEKGFLGKEGFLSWEIKRNYPIHRWRNSNTDKLDIKKYVDQLVFFAKRYGAQGIADILGGINQLKQDYGLNVADVQLYISLLKRTEFPEFHKAAIGIENLIKLETIPLQLNLKSTTGEEINLKNYKGKVVLVDFWSLGCSSCIAKMPEIKDVWQKYRDRGFEVISACFITGYRADGMEIYKDERQKINSVHERIGANWPLLLLEKGPKGEKNIIWSTYGFQSVPKLILLDEQGKLIHFDGNMTYKGGLEKLVKEHLNNKLKN